MRDYAKVAPQFWTGKTGKALKAAGPETVIVGLYLAMAVWKLPAVPVLAGAAMAAAAFVVSMRFVAQRSTTRTNA